MCGSCNKKFSEKKKKAWCAILSFWFLYHLFISLAILRIQDLFCSFLLPVAWSQVPLFSWSDSGIFIRYQGWDQGRQPGMQLSKDLLGPPEEIRKRISYEVEISFMLMMESVLLFLRSVLIKETKLMYKRVKDSWTLCQETSSLVAEVYLLRNSLSCCNKRHPKHNDLTKLESYLFSI